MADVVVEQLERRRWDELVSGFSDLGLSQTWEYGEAVAALQGAECRHVAIRDGGDVIGLADVRIKRIPLLGGGIAYISAGPLTRRGPTPNLDRFAAAAIALRQEFCDRQGLVLRILAPVSTPEVNEAFGAKLISLGFEPSDRGRSYETVLLDLSPELDDLRSSCGKMWRRCLRQSERADLSVEVGEDESLYRNFLSVYAEMRERKTFGIELDPDFYARLRPKLPEAERLRSYVARSNGELAGALVISMLGDTAFYLLGATNELGRKTRASYLLHWRVICEARERGLRWYDLGGIDEAENPGGYRFKSTMGGIEVRAAGPVQALPPGIRAHGTLLAETLYQRLRGR